MLLCLFEENCWQNNNNIIFGVYVRYIPNKYNKIVPLKWRIYNIYYKKVKK